MALLLIALFSASKVSAAPNFRVNSTGDGADPAVGNGVCETASSSRVCTLRAAIQEAIVNASTEIGITFSIPTSDPGYDAQTGAWTITLGSALPDLNMFSLLRPTTLNIIGPGANLLTVQKNVGSFRIFNVTTKGTVNFSGVTVTRKNLAATTSGNGGGIQNAGSGRVNISSCILRKNGAGGFGGAVANSSTGTVAITNSTLEDNAAIGIGGAISSSSEGTLNITGGIVRRNFSAGGRGGGIGAGGSVTVINTAIADNAAISPDQDTRAEGGGILLFGAAATLVNSTISGNLARGLDTAPGSLTSEGLGGGVYVISGNINIINCTIAANSAEGGSGFSVGSAGRGGGIVFFGNGTFNLSNSTISGNSARGGYGASGRFPGLWGGILASSPMNIKSTIVANNSGDLNPDVVGTFVSKGFNFIGIQDGSTGFTLATDKTGTIAAPLNPKFDSRGLRNNGGLTETIALQPSSPAIDKGSSVGLTGNLTTDQRGAGFPRTVDRAPANAAGGDGTDIGAFEL